MEGGVEKVGVGVGGGGGEDGEQGWSGCHRSCLVALPCRSTLQQPQRSCPSRGLPGCRCPGRSGSCAAAPARMADGHVTPLSPESVDSSAEEQTAQLESRRDGSGTGQGRKTLLAAQSSVQPGSAHVEQLVTLRLRFCTRKQHPRTQTKGSGKGPGMHEATHWPGLSMFCYEDLHDPA